MSLPQGTADRPHIAAGRLGAPRS